MGGSLYSVRDDGEARCLAKQRFEDKVGLQNFGTFALS